MGWSVKKFLFLVIFFLAFSVVGFGLDVEVSPIRNDIFLNESAIFEFNVYNNQTETSDYRFRVQPSFPDWSIFSDPSHVHSSGFNLDPNENKSFNLEINPLRDLDPKRYLLRYSFRDRRTNEVIESDYLSIRVKSRNIEDLSYPLVVRSNLNVDDFNVKPTDGLNFNLLLENRNPRDIGDVTINVKSNRSLFEEEIKTNLGPRFSDSPREDYFKSIDFEFDFDKFQEPINDIAFIEVRDEYDNLIFEDDFYYNILSFENKSIDESEHMEFLKYNYNFTIENNGNVRQNFSVRKPVDWFSRIFVNSRGHTFIRENDQTLILWECSLEPGQSCSSKMSVSFWPIIYVIFVLGILFFLFLIFESPLDIEKRVINKEINEDGSIILKFNLYIKNNDKKEVKEVKVYDTLPVMVSYLDSDVFGALMPDEVIRKGKKGSLLKWDIGVMEPLEERILAYKVKLKMNVVGKVILPGGIVKYRGVFDKLFEISSNKVEVVLE